MAEGKRSDVQDWNPIESLPDHFLIIMYGLRRSGKSVLMRQLLYDIWPRIQAHQVFLFSQTACVNSDQYDYLPGGEWKISDISSGNLEVKLKEIIDSQKEKLVGSDDQTGDGSKKRKNNSNGGTSTTPGKESKRSDNSQKKKRKRGRPRKSESKESKEPDQQKDPVGYSNHLRRSKHRDMRAQKGPGIDVDEIIQEAEQTEKTIEGSKNVLVILDDCCNYNSVRYSPSLSYLSTCGRHLKISIVILSQVVHGSGSVPPVVRTQADTIIMVAQPRSVKERELVAEQYLTAENKQGAKQAGLNLLETVTATPFRGMVIETQNNAARAYDEYCFGYGPVPFPFPHEDWKCGLPCQFEDGKEDEAAAEYEHDFFHVHGEPESDKPVQSSRPAMLQERKNYDVNFKRLPFMFSKAPLRLRPGKLDKGSSY